ncbi:MAG: hypothetical protein HYX20_00535 [Candidatus Yanofskybacteria bacterium]|nr:hypothetical protein [Candidatus Yanofskybacteria bacterium]
MDQNEILERLKSIVIEHEPPPEPAADTCWVDSDRCPYGFPNGRFQDRPEQICHLGGCKRLTVVFENDGFIGNYVSDALACIVEKNQVDLSSELRVIAEDKLGDELKQQILKLAAEIIRDSKQDKKIVRVDDI